MTETEKNPGPPRPRGVPEAEKTMSNASLPSAECWPRDPKAPEPAPYPLAECPHGAVVGYCAKCREEALDWVVSKCLGMPTPAMAPVHITPILEASLDRVTQFNSAKVAR